MKKIKNQISNINNSSVKPYPSPEINISNNRKINSSITNYIYQIHLPREYKPISYIKTDSNINNMNEYTNMNLLIEINELRKAKIKLVNELNRAKQENETLNSYRKLLEQKFIYQLTLNKANTNHKKFINTNKIGNNYFINNNNKNFVYKGINIEKNMNYNKKFVLNNNYRKNNFNYKDFKKIMINNNYN